MSETNNTEQRYLDYDGLVTVFHKIKSRFAYNNKAASDTELGLIKATTNAGVEASDIEDSDETGVNVPVQVTSDGTAFVNVPEINTDNLVDISNMDVLQVDWNKNDENSPLYVRNRTHFTEGYKIESSGEYNIDPSFRTVVWNDYVTELIPGERMQVNNWGAPIYATLIPDEADPETGLLIVEDEDNFLSAFPLTHISYIKQLDEMYIPDSIVRKGEVVNFAKDLTGHSEATEEIFTYRPTAGTTSVRDESTVIKRIKGNSLIWTQLVRNGNFADGTSAWMINNTSLSIDTDGSLKVNHLGTDSQGFSQSFYDRIPKGHKVLVVIDYKRSSATKKNLLVYLRTKSNTWDKQFVYDIADDKRRVDSVIITTSDDIVSAKDGSYPTSLIIYPFFGGTLEDYSNVYNVNVFDLTRMFGDGNEPATYAEFKEIFNKKFYPYCPPTVFNLKTTAIETVGFNLFNGEYAEVICDHTYYIGGEVASINIDGHEVVLNENRLYTPLASGNLYINGTNICVHLHHTGIRDGECATYVKNTTQLPNITKYLPHGLVGTSDIYDELVNNKIIKRWGVVDLGTLEWLNTGTNTENKRWYCAGVKDIIKPSAAAHLVEKTFCSKYKSLSANDTYLAKSGISVDINGTLHLYDSNYPNNDSKNAFIESLQGVLLYYQLLEPEIIPIDDAIQLDYYVEDFGTEKAIDNNDSAPFRADIVYQFNAVDRIRQNDINIEKLDTKIKTIESKLEYISMPMIDDMWNDIWSDIITED